jgi:murein DD-endopeptidase MepM/ murein hydrolase activator NlpD
MNPRRMSPTLRRKLVVAGFRAQRPEAPEGPLPRWKTWILWVSFVLLGTAVGLWRTPAPYATQVKTPEATAAEADRSEATAEETPGATTSEEPPLTLVTYTIQPGDTLSSIAQTFNTSAESIACINNLASPDRISVGEELSVMANATGLAVRVSRGDTLWDISRRYGVAVANMVRANNLASAEEIQVGQLLLLPGADPSSHPAQVASRSSSFIWPADGSVTSSFGWRIHPVTGEELLHEGIDIAASTGNNVYAAGSGTVSYLGWYGGYGRLIIISHGAGIETRYGHLSGYEVYEGEEVWAGELIGHVGESGTATGPNLHFEVRRSGKPVNPRDYLP